MGGLLIGLGYWAYNGVRDSIAQTRVTSLEALARHGGEGTRCLGRANTPPRPPASQRIRWSSSARHASRPTRTARVACQDDAPTRRKTSAGWSSRRCRRRAWSRSGSSTARESCWRPRIRRAAGSACGRARSGSGSTWRWMARRSSCGPIRKPSFRSRALRASGARSPGSWRRSGAAKWRPSPPWPWAWTRLSAMRRPAWVRETAS